MSSMENRFHSQPYLSTSIYMDKDKYHLCPAHKDVHELLGGMEQIWIHGSPNIHRSRVDRHQADKKEKMEIRIFFIKMSLTYIY